MIATFAMVRKLIVFLPSLHYCRTPGQSLYWKKLTQLDIGTLLSFRLRARAEVGECILTGVMAQHVGAPL
jgi:hypothetical protein